MYLMLCKVKTVRVLQKSNSIAFFWKVLYFVRVLLQYNLYALIAWRKIHSNVLVWEAIIYWLSLSLASGKWMFNLGNCNLVLHWYTYMTVIIIIFLLLLIHTLSLTRSKFLSIIYFYYGLLYMYMFLHCLLWCVAFLKYIWHCLCHVQHVKVLDFT